MSWLSDIGDFVEDVADDVKEVASDFVAPIEQAVNATVGTVVGPIAQAVSEIPLVGDVVEVAAPFGGMLGTFIGGPIGGAIGNAIGDQFGDGGGGFDFLDTAIGVFGGDLPGPLADVADNLMNGGSLIDSASSIFGGDIGDVAKNVLNGEMPDLGDLTGFAQQFLGDDMPDLGGFGGFEGIAQNILGGNMPDMGDIMNLGGEVLGGEGMPDLGGLTGMAGQIFGGDGAPDLGALIKTADSVFGGLGLGNLESAAQGILGDCMPGSDGDGGWFGSASPLIPDAYDFGGGCWSPPLDVTGILGSGGGGWLDTIAQQAESVAQSLPGGGGLWGTIHEMVEQVAQQVEQAGPMMTDPVETLTQAAEDATGTDFPDTDLDDLVFKLPGVDRDGAARDALEQLAQTGGLGEALATLSQDDLTTLVTRLVAPAASPAIDTVIENAAASGQAIDDLGLPSSVTGDATTGGVQQPADDFGDDLVTAGAVAGLGGPDTAGAMGEQSAAETGVTAAQDDFSLGLDSGTDAAGGGFDQPAPVEAFTPEPEPQSDFSQEIAQADAVEESFDSMFDDLGQGQG